jgi:hypothetical protein
LLLLTAMNSNTVVDFLFLHHSNPTTNTFGHLWNRRTFLSWWRASC